MQTIREILKWGHEALFLSSSSARLDAELLLAHVLKQPVTFLLAHDETSVGRWIAWKYERLIAKRKAHWPVAYLTGHKEFYFLDFEVNPHVLVPRPDTEILVEAVIDYVNSKSEIRNSKQISNSNVKNVSDFDIRVSNFLLLDVGTGSGCIAISVLKNIPELTAVAVDISRAALRVAKRNAKRHGVAHRIEFIRSDLLANIPLERFKNKDLVLTANLPYVPRDFAVNPETKFEPDSSLYGGPDGIEVYKRLMGQLEALKPRAVFLECFDFQKAVLALHLKGYELKRTAKMTGQARMMFLERALYYQMKKPTQCSLWKKIKSDAFHLKKFHVLEIYEEDSHFSRKLVKCKECGQLYLKEFYEEIDWERGNDPQYSTLVPVETQEDIDKVKKADRFELLRFTPQLCGDFPSDARKEKIYWVGK